MRSCDNNAAVGCFLCVHRSDLHGDRVFNKHRSQLSVQLKEDLSLTGLVQVAQRQRFNVQRLASLQLHLKSGRDKRERERQSSSSHTNSFWGKLDVLDLDGGCSSSDDGSAA